MFLLNLGYRWTLNDEVRGAVFLPTGNSCAKILRAPLPDLKRVILDPQLYLAGLNAGDCRKVCARLASYPWFGVDLPAFDSTTMSRRQWDQEMQARVADVWPGKAPEDAGDIRQACTTAIDIQQQISCTHVILPAPLITEREDEAQLQAEWLDEGLAAAQDLEVGQPLLATVALAETVLNSAAFEATGFLDTVVDQITAREGLDGVYIVVAQNDDNHPFENSEKVQQAYLHLSKAFSDRGYGTVLTNFADVLGLACMGVGATDFSTGPSQSLRRLSMSGFRDAGGGKAFPKFYSHKIVAELATETDLDRVVQKRLLRKVEDRTVHSEGLMDTLAAGGSASQLQAWAESQNNVATAQRHFIARMAMEARALRGGQRAERIREWLEEAAAGMLFVNQKMGNDGKVYGAPTLKWLELFEAAVER